MRPAENLIDVHELSALIGWIACNANSRVHATRKRDPSFPKPVQYGLRRKAWYDRNEVLAWKQNRNKPPEGFLTLTEAAKQLNCCRHALRQRKELVSSILRAKRRVYVSKDAVQAYLKTQALCAALSNFKELGEQFGVSNQRVHQWSKKPGFPTVKALRGRSAYYSSQEVRAWWESQTHVRGPRVVSRP